MKKMLLLATLWLLNMGANAAWMPKLDKAAPDSSCPEVSFTFAPNQGNGESNSYVFISTSSVFYGDMSYLWDFDDVASGVNNSSTAINPLHVFTSGGAKQVKLTVTNTQTGCSIQLAQTVTVSMPAVVSSPTPFTPTFTYSATSPCSAGGEVFSFSASSPAPTDVTYVWDFGDGYTATGESPTHSYAYSNTYWVTLKAVAATGILGSSKQSIVVVGNNAKPTAAFTYLVNTQNGNAVTFLSQSIIPSGNMTYSWDFGDGATASGSSPTHVYAGSNTYTVTLTVTGAPGGCQSVLSKDITFTEPLSFIANSASFTVATPVSQCLTGNQFVFTNTSITGPGISYLWDFGDGTTSTAYTPFTVGAPKIYSAFGDYIVKLTVSGPGGTVFTTKTVSVEPMPKAVFALYVDRFILDGGPYLQPAPTPFTSLATPTEIEYCFKYPIDFSYMSNSSIARGQMYYSWDFKTNAIHYRDGNSTYINPRIIFDTAGKYDVTLTVISDKGCKDSIRQTVRLSQPKGTFTVSYPQPDIHVNPLVTIGLGTVRDPGYPENTAGQLTGLWTNTNGSVPATNSPVVAPPPFHYLKGGSYTPTLKVTSKIGCTNTFTQSVLFRVKPTKPIITSYSVSYNAFGQPVVALAGTGSVDETPQNLRYTWNYGIGSNLTQNTNTGSPTAHNHTYTRGAATATTTINLYVRNNNFDNGTLRDTAVPVIIDARIKPLLTAGVNVTNSAASISAPSASFSVGTALHDAAPGAMVAYLWELFDGAVVSGTPVQTSTSATPTFSNLLGNHQYTVKVTVTNSNGGLVADANVAYPTVVTFTSAKIKPLLTAAASATPSGASGSAPSETVQVGASLNDADGSLVYSWELYDGNAAVGTVLQTSTTTAPVFSGLLGNHQYTAKVIVTNSNGGLQADANVLYPTTVTFTTSSIKPVLTAAVSSVSSTPGVGAPSETLNLGIILNDAPDGSLVYSWKLYEGATAAGTVVQSSTVASPTFNNLKGNTQYTATVTITNANGGLQPDANVLYPTTYTFVSAAIKPALTTAASAVNATPSTSAPSVELSVGASLNDLPSGLLSYSWKLYEGATASGTILQSSSTATPTFSGLKGNTQYTAEVIVTNTNGGLVADANVAYPTTVTFTSSSIKPTASFSSNVNYHGDNYANPDVEVDASSALSNDADGTLTYAWNFGDGSTATGSTTSHNYTSGGTKTITLTVTNSNGGLTSIISHDVNVVITPKASISVSVNTADPLHNTVQFFADNTVAPGVNSSIVNGTITVYDWSYDVTYIPTGITTNNQSLSNNYLLSLDLAEELDNYIITARLTATSDLGVSDIATATWSNSGLNSGYTPFVAIRNGQISNSVKVNKLIQQLVQLSAYPNPAQTTIQIGYPVYKGSFVQIYVYDQQGKLVKTDKKSVIAGTKNISPMQVGSLPKGTYNILIVGADGQKIGTTRFIKAH